MWRRGSLRPYYEALITKAYWVLGGEWVREKPATGREEERMEGREAERERGKEKSEMEEIKEK